MWELDYKERCALKNWCFWIVVLEKTLESPLDCKEIQPVHPKGDQSWVFNGRTDVEAESNTLATWRKELTNLKRPWCWEILRTGREGDDGGWDGWMASPTRWTWVWVDSGSWWWTGRPSMLRFIGSQRVRHDWVTELNWTEQVPSCLRSQLCIKRACTRPGEALLLIFIHCAPREHTLELERSPWLFCTISVNSPWLHWGMSGVRFRDQLASFSARPPLIAHAYLPT